MGCCYSNENETTEEDNGERKPLIPHPNPVSKPPNGTDWITTSVPSARTDEQALLTSILTKTAQNIIDVSAADSVMMEQHEYMDKARQYSTKLAVLSNTLPQKKSLALPSLTSQPHQVLASDLVPYSDVQQVSKIAAYAYSAISQIKVDAKEELVVQFAIP
ncbi:ragulator complex protein LAMTOR1 [Clinocottus analis]|uniref:ragulator complex protein LAMTOR1 n=1 Tax=Clinocottus analis TaxID=304258 RepID=UPI0035BF0746